MGQSLTHFDESGNAVMVDVSEKDITEREAIATGKVFMASATLALIEGRQMKKGDVLTVAQLAGIMGAKKTPDLIPLCHPLALTKVTVDLTPNTEENCIEIQALCKLKGKTGVEMEALTAVSVAALTVYDMCKAVDKAMRIGEIHLVYKAGGRSGTYSGTYHAQGTDL